MTDKRRMSLVPPKVSSEDKLKAFIEEPDKKFQQEESETNPLSTTEKNEPEEEEITPQKTQYPWEAPGVTPEIIKPFVLRLQLPVKLKAEYIVKNSLEHRSLHDYYMKAILSQIDHDIDKLLGTQS